MGRWNGETENTYIHTLTPASTLARTKVCVAAEKEYSLERTLANMKVEWSEINFEVKSYKETGTFVVGGIDDIVSLLDDHIVKTQTMRGSMFSEICTNLNLLQAC